MAFDRQRERQPHVMKADGFCERCGFSASEAALDRECGPHTETARRIKREKTDYEVGQAILRSGKW